MKLKLFDKALKSFVRFFGDSALNTFLFHFITFEISPVSTKFGISLYNAGLLIHVLSDIVTIFDS